MLENKKKILICMTSSISCFRAVEYIYSLKKMGYIIDIIVSKNTLKFLNKYLLETLFEKKIYDNLFSESSTMHIELSKKDLIIVLPASANIISKIKNGICDDLITTTIAASTCPKLFVPSMNSNMYNNPIIKDNINYLKNINGYFFQDPIIGTLLCGDEGVGKIASFDSINSKIDYILEEKKFKGINSIVTLGPTIEFIDPVRFISNPSSGKMGYNIAYELYKQGANVTVIKGPTSINFYFPDDIKVIEITSADDMNHEINKYIEENDILIMTAAVSDYKAKKYEVHKIKKDNINLNLELEKNIDILSNLKKRDNQFFVGFSMETKDFIPNAKKKCINKNLDLIVLNEIGKEGIGFKSDTNKCFLINKNEVFELDFKLKKEIAKDILNYINKNYEK